MNLNVIKERVPSFSKSTPHNFDGITFGMYDNSEKNSTVTDESNTMRFMTGVDTPRLQMILRYSKLLSES